MKSGILLVYWALASLAAAAPTTDEFTVIVSKSNNVAVDKALVASIYLGEIKSWPGGGSVVAYDLPDDNPVRIRFSHDVLSKSVANMKAMWAQFTFSGRAMPPRQLASDEEVKRAVSANPHAIGYIRASSLDDSVRAALH